MSTINLKGTSNSSIKIQKDGVVLANSSGNLLVRNTTNTADAEVTTSKLNNSGDSIDINSDAAGSGTDYKITVARPTTGMSADWTLTLPTGSGTNGQILQTNGSGTTNWVNNSTSAAGLAYFFGS